jgi:hypothetical protein
MVRAQITRLCLFAAACGLAAVPCSGAATRSFFLSAADTLASAPMPEAPIPEAPAVRDLEEETRSWSRVEGMIGSGERRRMAEARQRVALQPMFFDDPELDPNHEWLRRAVRDGYVKLYRELLEERFPLDAALERGVRSRLRPAEREGDEPSWRPLLSPRLAVGSHGYLGLRLRFPDTGFRELEHVTLQVRQGFSDGESAVGLRYSNGPRYVQVESVTGDRETGKRYGATFRIRF